ncbi:unnamed protein product [Gemmataceae bacterium]|nr:unnamed protein product [Gemmataceae bacterium]VTT99719.1 unnamed protein product [Gemmataceae bacterium]
MTNGTGRTARRAIAALIGLGGLGVYATAQQPKPPLVVKSSGTPGVYEVAGPTPAAYLPPTVIPGVPVQPADPPVVAREPAPVAPLTPASHVAPVAAKPGVLPGVPVPPAAPTASVATAPAVPPKPPALIAAPAVSAKPVPAAPTPPVEFVREQMPLAPLPPAGLAPPATTQAAVSEGPLAPVAATVPAPQAPKPVAPPAASLNALVAPEAALAKPRVIVEARSTQTAAADLPAAPPAAVKVPGVPSPPVLLAPVPAAQTPVVPTAPRVPPAPVAQASPTPGVVPTVRNPVSPAPVASQADEPAVVADEEPGASCARCGKGHSCCVCVPATVPPPVGASVRAAFATQRANALDDSTVIYCEDFDAGTDRLNPTGERHVAGIARRFDQTRGPVKVEPTGDPALDLRRTSTVISALTKAGVPVQVAASRVQGGVSRAEGMPATDIEPAFVRYSFGGYGVGGAGATYGAYTTFGPFALYR